VTAIGFFNAQRRRTLALVGLSFLPAIVRGGEPRKRIAIGMHPGMSQEEQRIYWVKALTPHGFVDGHNLEISIFRAESLDWLGAGAPEWRGIAERVVASRPDLIIIHGMWMPYFRELTPDLPLVSYGGLDFETMGGMETARRPGGNITGVVVPFLALQRKRFELLKDLHPRARRLALVTPMSPYNEAFERNAKQAAMHLGMGWNVINLIDASPTRLTIDALRNAKADVVDFTWSNFDPPLFDALIKSRIASSFAGEHPVPEGGLLAMTVRGMGPLLQRMVVRVLQGAVVATMPLEQPVGYYSILNMRTAKALGLSVTESVLLRMDKVVQ
jgi:putative ABC transport system substrate-binding protein